MATRGGRRIVLMDSISLIGPGDADAIIVCGSHGGAISAAFAAKFPPSLVLFNDAGGGKGGAGRAALELLATVGIACATVGHDTARIGEAEDAWLNGRLSAVNELAARAGLRAGDAAQTAVEAFATTAADDPDQRRHHREDEP